MSDLPTISIRNDSRFRRAAMRIPTGKPGTFIEASVTYVRPDGTAGEGTAPMYRIVVAPVKVEGMFEIRTAYSGVKWRETAPARFSLARFTKDAEAILRSDKVRDRMEFHKSEADAGAVASA